MHQFCTLVLLTSLFTACEDSCPPCGEDSHQDADTDSDIDTDTDTDTDADSDADSDSDTDTGPVVENNPPSVHAVRIQGPGCEQSVTSDMELVCLITGASEDADGDSTSYRFEWLREGEASGVGIPVLDSSHTAPGETWTCEVTPSDGIEDGEPASASVDILGCSSLYFSGNDGGVVVPDLAGIDLGAELTIEAWVRWDGSTDAQWHTIASQGQGAAQVEGGWLFAVSSAADTACDSYSVSPGQLVARVEGGPCSMSTATIPQKSWIHVAAVLDSGSWTIWVDGVSQTRVVRTDLVSVEVEEDLVIGTTPNGGSPWGFLGNIDEVRVMTTVHYTEYFLPSAHPIPETGTIGLWHFDEGEGSTAHDTMSDGHDGAIQLAIWSKDSSCDTE